MKSVLTAIYKKTINRVEARGFADWKNHTRSTAPRLKNDPENAPLQKCPETGLEIMHSRDFTGGMNHIILVNEEFEHPSNSDYALCNGVWSSSESLGPIDAKKIEKGDYTNIGMFVAPHKIDPNFKGNQYFHPFNPPRLISRSCLQHHEPSESFLQLPYVIHALKDLPEN